jgi:hypothetical protein
METLNAWLDDCEEKIDPQLLKGEPGSNNLLLTAPAGRGKTALLVRWINDLPSGWDVVFVPISIRYQTNQALTFYQALATRLGGVLPETIPEPRSDPATYYREKATEYLDRIAQECRRCLVVIDGLDEARGWKLDTAVLPFRGPKTLKIVVSARELAGDRGPRDWLDRLGWTPPQSSARSLQVPLLSEDGVRDVLQRMNFPPDWLSPGNDIVSQLHHLTERGDPLLLQLYAQDLLAKGHARLRPEDLASLDPGFGAYFKRWLEDQREEWRASGVDVATDVLDAMLAVLANAFGPLKLSDLEELVSRVLPGQRFFTIHSIAPLQRFVLGDGVATGFALAHPKLAIYLQNEYFGRSRIISVSQNAFMQWMREVVQAINGGDRPPHTCPEYALLFYSQHLGQSSEADRATRFRELLEGGWRLAWQSYEEGFHGFGRDVELARRALHDAIDRDPRRLQEPRLGLSALVRCALCVSSIRSIGSGIPGVLLAEFLASKGITARQALSLAQVKDDGGRADAIPLIMPHLGAEMRSEAYASLREIRSPATKISALTAILEHLQDFEQRACVQEIVRTSQKLEQHADRVRALEGIRRYLPEQAWSEAFAAEERRADEEQRAAQGQADVEPQSAPDQGNDRGADSSETPATSDKSFDGYDIGRALREEAENSDLSDAQKAAILFRMRDAASIYVPDILAKLAPTFTPDLMDLAKSCVLTREDTLFLGPSLEALAPYLAPEERLPTLIAAVDRDVYGMAPAIVALASLCGHDELELALGQILEREPGYRQNEVIGAIFPHLPDDLRSRVLTYILRLAGYRLVSAMEKIAPLLSEHDLGKAVARVAAMPDIEERGRALATLVPRHRELNLPLAATDAYKMSFAIGDRTIQSLAEATFRSDRRSRGGLEPALQKTLFDLNPMAGRAEFVISAFTGVVLAMGLPQGQRIALLEECAAKARSGLSSADELFPVLSLIGSRLGLEQGKAFREEAIALASSRDVDSGMIVIFLTIFPPEEARRLLQIVRDRRDSAAATSDLDYLVHIDNLVEALTEDNPEDVVSAKIVDILPKIYSEEDVENRLASLLFALIFSPALPEPDLKALIAELLAEIDRQDDEETRTMMTMVAASYLPTEQLVPRVSRILDFSQTLSRPALLMGLAFGNGVHREIWDLNPVIAGNMIGESALLRVGGALAAAEISEAVSEICQWWP